MAEAFVELGAEGVNYVTENHWDTIHHHVTTLPDKVRGRNTKGQGQSQDQGQDQQEDSRTTVKESVVDYNTPSASGSRRKQRNRLPSPEGDDGAAAYYSGKENSKPRNTGDNYTNVSRNRRKSRRDSSFERESQTSEQVIREYEGERDDPRRHPETVLSKKDLNKLRRDSKMSHANGYGSNLNAPSGYGRQQGNSQPPPKSRYYDDDEESDYDDRSGRRYRSSGRGYDDYDDDKDYDREVITTERYRGPPGSGPPVSGALVVSAHYYSVSHGMC